MGNFFKPGVKRTKKITTARMPFGVSYNLVENKGGGVNKPGRFGGVYKARNEKSLFKQDQKKGKKTDDDRPRIAKVLGEAVVGSLLKSLYPLIVAPNIESKNNIAEVRLVRANVPETKGQPDNNLYLQSIFINDYQGDLWVLAYRHHYKKELEVQLNAANNPTKEQALVDEIDKYLKRRYMMLSNMMIGLEKKIDKAIGNDELLGDLRAQWKKIKEDRDNIKKDNGEEKYPREKIEEIIRGRGDAAGQLFANIAKMKTSAMKRPSAVFRMKPREIVSQYLIDHPKMKTEFCDQMALRLLFGDRGVHNANFGVRKDANNNLHCCSLDYGTGFFNLSGDVDLYDLLSSGLKTTKVYKYHFREYPGIIYSDEMAKAFIKAGSLKDSDIEKSLIASIKTLRDNDLNVESVKKICAHAGMKSRDYAKLNSTEAMLNELEKFAKKQIPLRQKAFKERGYGLLLENCIKKDGKVDQDKLKEALKTNPGLAEFALTGFKKMKLAKSSGIEAKLPLPRIPNPISDWVIKNKIIQAVVDVAPRAERIAQYQKLIRYYNGKSQQANYAIEATAELNMIKLACNEIKERLNEMKDLDPNAPGLKEALRSVDEVLTSINANPDGLTRTQGVAYYGVEAEVFNGPGRENEIQTLKDKYIERPDVNAPPPPLRMDQRERTSKPKLSEPLADTVYARVIHNQIKDGKKTFEVAAVQRKLENGTFKQEIHVEDRKKANNLSAEAYRIWGLVETKNFFAATPDKKNGITLNGNWPKKLKRTVVAYCAILQAEQEAAKAAALERGESFDKEVNYSCYDGATNKKLVVEKSEINYLKARLSRPDDTLTVALKNVDIPEVKSANQYRI